jgi:CelD/BcsL family acetyltransferase involved in cellulose biosynthesis
MPGVSLIGVGGVAWRRGQQHVVPVIVADGTQLDRLEGVWRELWARTRPIPPMLEWSWARTWWALHAGEGQLMLVLVEDDAGRPVGLAPLYLRDEGLKDPRRCLRTVQFLGTGEREEDEVTGEYTCWLAAPEDVPAVTAAVIAELTRRRNDWDRLRLERMSPAGGVADQLEAALRADALHVDRSSVATFRSPVARLDTYLTALPSANFRHRCRRAVKEGRALGVELVRAGSRAEAEPMFRALIDLHQRRWQERGKPGAFASEVFASFQQRMLDRYFPAGDGVATEHAWLVGLRRPPVGDSGDGPRWLAVRLLLRAGDTLYDYLSGVDTGTDDGVPVALAPGLLLHLFTIDACAAEGLAVYDLMCGDYDYKRKLALEEDSLPTLDLFARGVRSRLWLTARDIGRQLRSARRVASPAPEAPGQPAAAPPAQPAGAEP